MKKLGLALFTLAAAATGCGDNHGSGPDGDVDDPDDPIGPLDELPVPLTPAGRYSVQSELDLATGVPGRAGVILDYFLDATDDPDDPTRFLVEQLIAAMPEGALKHAVTAAAPAITGYLNDRLLAIAPELLGRMIDLGDAFGQAAKHLGTLETLDVDAAGRATRRITGVHFVVDGVPLDVSLVDVGLADLAAADLRITLDDAGWLSISEHRLVIAYGALLRVAIDHAIVPLLDPGAHDVGDLLARAVNCQRVGRYISEVIGVGSPSTYEGACTAGLEATAAVLYAQLARLDGSMLELELTGAARGVDRDRDGTMDGILSGLWTGTIGNAGTPVPLRDATFVGVRK
ncbi:MAG: hypothetical protein H0X17_09160 [Deltaproteobacteria bacterium]|nr:hypothetical protein [Deltaproteobacteria bacterium]